MYENAKETIVFSCQTQQPCHKSYLCEEYHVGSDCVREVWIQFNCDVGGCGFWWCCVIRKGVSKTLPSMGEYNKLSETQINALQTHSY